MNFIENETAEKLRGGYYTPADIAAFLSRWVIEAQPRAVLEPSCGDGAFVRALDGLRLPRGLHVTGCELHPAEAEKAREASRKVRGLHATVHDGDFLTWFLDRSRDATAFDAVLGNPPFVRYQYLTDDLQARAERVIRQFGLRFTKHTNAWVPFVVASIAMLRPGGRLAMVVPSELLHVLHADSAREYLLRECSRVLIIDPEEIWFEDTLQGVVLLLAEKRTDENATTKGRLSITRTRGRAFLAEDPGALFERSEYVAGESFPHKWTTALLSTTERNTLAELRENRSVRRFAEVAGAAVGIVTGANKFFLVPDAVVREHDLGDFAHRMFGRSEHVPGVVYDERTHKDNQRAGYPTNFLWFKDTPLDALPEGARRYIASGEKDGLHRRFKCRIRSPWYSVPSVFTTPVGMLKRSHDYPRLVLNSAEAFTTDTAYRITPRGVRPEQLVYGFVNSLTALCAELEGRHYGGGVLELVPSEINRLLLPVVPATKSAVKQLDDLFRSGVASDEILERQDREVLGALGVSARAREELHAAWWALRSRRQRVTDDADDDSPESGESFEPGSKVARAG